MKKLAEYKEVIHTCSKCGLCQSVCPVYKITKNDCTVSRGLFIMLKNIIKGEIKMTKKLNKYLDLCLKCGACSKFCPSDIDVVQIITSAKVEYFKKSKFEKLVSFCLNLGIKLINLKGRLNKLFSPKSKKFDRKVIFFGGCGVGVNNRGMKSVIKLLNNCKIEVLSPNFECCGIPFYVRGDVKSYRKYKSKFEKMINKYGINEIVTTCASCEKTLKGYGIEGLQIRNLFEYIRENELKLSLKKMEKVTFHKPCNIENFEDIKWILENTENLEYIEMKDFDSCCGLNGITKLNEHKIMSQLYIQKQQNILNTGVKTVLTSCLGCEVALKLHSLGKYNVQDFTAFLYKRIKR